MNNCYSVLTRRIKELNKNKLLSTRYIKSLNDIEIITILNYSPKDFKIYMEIIECLYKNNIIVTKEIEDNAKKVLNIIFSNINKKNKNDSLTLITETKFLHCNNVVSATVNFLSLENKFKVDSVVDIFSNYERPYLINANKIILDIKRCSNKKQVNALTNLFSTESLLRNKNLGYLVELILKNPKYKYYQFPVYLAIYNDFLTSNKYLDLLSILFKLDNIDDIKLVFDCFRTPSMLNSSICIPFINSIIKEGHKNYYKYFNKVVLNKDRLSDISFKKIINAIKLCKNKYQIDGLISLMNSNIINNSSINNIIIDSIIKSREEYKIKSILNIAFNKKILNNLNITNNIINGIVNSKHDYQVNTLLFSIDYLENTIYYKDIILEIIKLDSINCKYVNLFLQKELYDRHNYLNLFYRLIDYKTKEQKELYLQLLDIKDLFNYNINYTFNMIEKCNEYQCKALLELYNYKFYKNEHFNLIKYLFIFKDQKHVYLFKEILIQIDRIGYEKSLEIIRLISNSNIDIDVIYDYYINILKKRIVEFDVKDLEFYEKRTKNEVDKIKKLKISNIE